MLEMLKALARLSEAIVDVLERVSPSGSARLDTTEESNAVIEPGDEFVFEVATRFNEGLLGNIDTLDAVLTAILAGVAVIAIFAIDKIRELQTSEELAALSVLAVSALACIVGFGVGTPLSSLRSRDLIDPRTFIPTFANDPGTAILDAIKELMDAGGENMKIRRWKRGLALVAIVALLAGAIIVALARAYGR